MNQIKIVEIRNFLNKDDANFKQLIKDFQGLFKLEKALTKGWIDFDNQLKHIAQNEMNGMISGVFQQVSSCYVALNETRKNYLDLIEHKIIPSINGQISEVKDKRATLVDYEKKKQTEEKKDLAFRMNSDAAKTNQMHQALEEAKKESGYAASNLNNKMRMYINEKNAELKAMFQHLINCQMLFHAAGLEKLSELAQFINRCEDEKETVKILEIFLGAQSKDKPHQAEKIEKKQ